MLNKPIQIEYSLIDNNKTTDTKDILFGTTKNTDFNDLWYVIHENCKRKLCSDTYNQSDVDKFLNSLSKKPFSISKLRSWKWNVLFELDDFSNVYYDRILFNGSKHDTKNSLTIRNRDELIVQSSVSIKALEEERVSNGNDIPFNNREYSFSVLITFIK
jgi:hypothetical protein